MALPLTCVAENTMLFLVKSLKVSIRQAALIESKHLQKPFVLELDFTQSNIRNKANVGLHDAAVTELGECCGYKCIGVDHSDIVMHLHTDDFVAT